MPMSGDRSGGRYDVVADTRRRWSAAAKAAIVAEASGNCPNISAVARRHGIKPSLLFRWKKELCKASVYLRPSEARVAERQELTKATATAPTFVPVALPAPSLPLGISSAKSGTIDILIAGGRTVRVGADVDMAALVRIIAALEDRL
jgi:transposase